MNKDYYVYKEYDNLCGRYEERTNITKIFDNLEELLKYIEERKIFYNSFANTRTIKIDIIKNRKNEENKNE